MQICDLEDTIAAVSSPPGSGVRAVVRISGPAAFTAARAIIDCRWPRELPARVVGSLRLPEVRTPAVIYLFEAPKSYTGQDVVELHVPGSPVLAEMLLESAYRLGVRPAGPGEFTARSYLNGKMNLVEAEAVAAVIAAQSDQQLRAAEALLHGRLTQTACRYQSDLADLLALIEAGIDFSEEDIEFISPEAALVRMSGVRQALQSLQASSIGQERLDVLPRVLLAGPPNVGKSTLLNRLTGMDRAICSPIPGTTRDVLSAPLTLTHGECLMLDAAGIDANHAGVIDAAAHAAALRAATECDLLCLVLDPACCDGGSQMDEVDPRRQTGRTLRPDLLVINKADTASDDELAAVVQESERKFGKSPLITSALTAQGLEDLKRQLDLRLFVQGQTIQGDALALSARHREAIDQAVDAVLRAESLVQSEVVGELPAMEIREAIDQLAALAGELPTDEILGRIFSRFCIGK